MKHTMLRIVAVIAVIACVAMGFVGCNKNTTNNLVIGCSGPLTGDAAQYGESVKRGAQIAVDEINAAGGINGFQIQFEMLDDQATADMATTNYNTLMDKGMKVSLGCVTSGSMAAFADEAKEDGVLLVSPSASAEECIKHDNAFRICFGDADQGAYAAKFIAEKKLGTKVAVIYDSSDAYSAGLHDAFIAAAKDLSYEVVADEAFTSDTNTDFSSQISKAKATGADLVFLPIYYTQAAAILDQAQGELDGVKFLGCDGLDGIIPIAKSKEIIEDVILLTPFYADSADETVKNFVTKFKEKYNATPDQFAADAYDAVYAIKAAMEKAELKDLNDADFNKKLIEAMTQIEVKGTTGTMKWSANGAPTKNASAVVIKDGKYVEFK